MDTTTVLEIIEMIDSYSSAAYKKIEAAHKEGQEASAYDIGVFDQMSSLSDHLQEYIESQLNAAENNTGE
jgi:hypothetical protein